MALAMFVPALVVGTVIAVHYFLFLTDTTIANREYKQEVKRYIGDHSTESHSRTRMIRSFPAFGLTYRIVPDGNTEGRASSENSTQTTKQDAVFSILSGDDLLPSLGDPLSGVYFEISPPPAPTQPIVSSDRGRPPSVRTRIEPFGIRNAVTIVIMIDSLGMMAPITDSESNTGNKIPYLLRTGSHGDAEKVYSSLLTWTFAPAWDESGRPAPARFTITHTPGGR
jgi:hypothetical protein